MLIYLRAITRFVWDLRAITQSVQDPRAVTRWGGFSVRHSKSLLWGDKNRGAYTRLTVGWQHRLNGHGFGWTLGVGDGQGGLACCSLWGHKESDTTERLNWTELSWTTFRLISEHKVLCIHRLGICKCI